MRFTGGPWIVLFWVSAALFWILSFAFAETGLELLLTSLFLVLMLTFVLASRRRRNRPTTAASTPEWIRWLVLGAGALVVISLIDSASTEDAILDGLLLVGLLALFMDTRSETATSA
jgi:hypothetical protein